MKKIVQRPIQPKLRVSNDTPPDYSSAMSELATDNHASESGKQMKVTKKSRFTEWISSRYYKLSHKYLDMNVLHSRYKELIKKPQYKVPMLFAKVVATAIGCRVLSIVLASVDLVNYLVDIVPTKKNKNREGTDEDEKTDVYAHLMVGNQHHGFLVFARSCS